MSQITLRILKGTALTQSEMDDNLKNLINSSSIDKTTGALSLFTSESSGATKTMNVLPTWIDYSGSTALGVASVTGSLIVSGDITAQQFNTEIISSSTIFESGSTIFGDDSNDLHQITGSLLVTGSQILSGSQTVSGSSTITGAIDSTGMSSKIRFHYNEYDDLPSATTYHGMFAHVHATGSAYFAHGGNWVQLANSSSFATDIATLNAASASHETSIATLTAASASHETAINTLNAKTLISSSDQIDDEISGSLGVNATFIRSLNASSISGSFGGITAASVSGSLGDNATLIRSLTGASISGSFVATSASLATNIATNLASVGTLTTDKANKSEISGSFTSTSASLAANIATNLASVGTLTTGKADADKVSGSLGVNASLIRSLTGTVISGSLGVNAALIRSLTGTTISGSFTAPSSSISTRLDSLEDASATAPAGTVSGSAQVISHLPTGTVSGSSAGTAQGQFKLNGVDVNAKDLQTSSNVTFAQITGSAALINGAITATGDITAFHSSDERLKYNITPIKGALDKINQIGGYEFDWNDKSEHTGHDVGVIAQEIEKVLPELVVDRDTGYKAVRYDKIVALLINAIKEQQLQIYELKSKL